MCHRHFQLLASMSFQITNVTQLPEGGVSFDVSHPTVSTVHLSSLDSTSEMESPVQLPLEGVVFRPIGENLTNGLNVTIADADDATLNETTVTFKIVPKTPKSEWRIVALWEDAIRSMFGNEHYRVGDATKTMVIKYKFGSGVKFLIKGTAAAVKTTARVASNLVGPHVEGVVNGICNDPDNVYHFGDATKKIVGVVTSNPDYQLGDGVNCLTEAACDSVDIGVNGVKICAKSVANATGDCISTVAQAGSKVAKGTAAVTVGTAVGVTSLGTNVVGGISHAVVNAAKEGKKAASEVMGNANR